MPEEEGLLLAEIMPGVNDTHPAAPRHWYSRQRQHRRGWKCDYIWRDHRLIVEVEGIVYGGKGRHQTEAGLSMDAEKYNAAAILGYTLLRYTPQQLAKGRFHGELEALIALGRLRADPPKAA